MVTRLVAMCILTNHTGTENRQIFLPYRYIGKHTIQLCRKLVLSACQGNQSLNVVLHRPEIMPGIAFTDVCRIFIGIEVRLEDSPVVYRLHESCSRIEYIPIILRTLEIFIRQFSLAHLLRHFSNTEVIECIFQSTAQ